MHKLIAAFALFVASCVPASAEPIGRFTNDWGADKGYEYTVTKGVEVYMYDLEAGLPGGRFCISTDRFGDRAEMAELVPMANPIPMLDFNGEPALMYIIGDEDQDPEYSEGWLRSPSLDESNLICLNSYVTGEIRGEAL